jgi:hypothetical protein
MIVFKTTRYQLKAKSKELVTAECCICKNNTGCRECSLEFVVPKVNKKLLKEMMENQAKFYITGRTQCTVPNTAPQANISFEKFILPMIRTAYPTIIAADMLAPDVFYLCSKECIAMFALKSMI